LAQLADANIPFGRSVWRDPGTEAASPRAHAMSGLVPS
jgi:hypothetical protein